MQPTSYCIMPSTLNFIMFRLVTNLQHKSLEFQFLYLYFISLLLLTTSLMRFNRMEAYERHLVLFYLNSLYNTPMLETSFVLRLEIESFSVNGVHFSRGSNWKVKRVKVQIKAIRGNDRVFDSRKLWKVGQLLPRTRNHR